MFGLNSNEIDLICSVFKKYQDIDEVILYGSRAMGNFKPGSDVDFALKGALHEETVSNVYAQLNERTPLPYKFDVLSYSELTNLSLKEHIDVHGQSFYKKTTDII